MIDPKSLRIGNWLYHKESGRAFQVSYHEIRYATLHPEDDPYIPITLTPEMLQEKCGFKRYVRSTQPIDPFAEKVSSQWDYIREYEDGLVDGYQIYEGEKFALESRDGVVFYPAYVASFYNDAWLSNGVAIIKLRYLHELQNFATLTGKELEIAL